MKKLYLSLLISVAAIMLGIGIWSVVHFVCIGRALPQVSWKSLLDGSYTAKLEDTYTKAFPARDTLLVGNRAMNHFYYFSVLNQNTLTLDYQGGAEFGGERLQQPEQEQQPKPEAAPESKVASPDEKDVTAVGAIIINGNRAMDIPTADNEIIRSYSNAVNLIAQRVGGQTRTFSLVTPNAGQFYSPVSSHTGIHDQKAMLDLYRSCLSQQVIPVDVYPVLAEHADEYIFFRTDHHWTQRGAYYAYTAFCRAAGFRYSPLDSYQTGEYPGFVGSMYNYTSNYPQSEALKNEPDILTYYLPKVPTHARYYLDAEMTEHTNVPVIDIALRDEVDNKYLCFLCGDTPICIIETEAEGGTCVVLKESYGNAFIPFLTEHYSKIIAIDPREFNGEEQPKLNLPEFIKAQHADDLLILNYPFMMNSKAYVKQLENLVP